MERACDMDKPVGYWVRQCASDGRTVVVKVIHEAMDGQATSIVTENPRTTSEKEIPVAT
jgi:hypothetical protein